MELKRYAVLLWRWLWLIVLGTVLAGSAAFLVSWYTVPIYEASTTLLINQSPSSSAAPDYTSLLTSERLARTYAEWLRKRPVLQAVIEDLDLPVDAEALAQRVRVAPVRDTQLIVVTVEDANPQRAADIANAIVTVFSEQNRALQSGRYAESKQSLQQEMDRVQADIDTTQAQLAALAVTDNPVQMAERDRLQTLLTQTRSSYTTLLERFEAVRLAEVQTTDSVSIVEEAQPELTPVRPRTLMNTLLAVIVGAMLAIGIVFLLEYLDDSVKSREEVEELTSAPTLAAIARIAGKELPEKLVIATDTRSPIAEAYRVLRTNIELSAIGQSINTLVVTSSSPAEGKSTTAANLAIALARAGRRVILVDTDLRRPSLHKFFQRTNIRGVTTALFQREGTTIHDHLVPTSVENLLLMPSGPLPPNPAEILGLPHMAKLVAELKAQADVVLFDSPPLLAVTDATLLSRLCDATLLVVLAASTRASALRRAREQLMQAGTRVVGTVLNQVGTAGGAYDYYYYYYYAEGERRKRNGYKPALSLPFRHSKNGSHTNGSAAAASETVTDDLIGPTGGQ